MRINEIETDRNGNIIVVGHFNGTMDVDPGPGVTMVTPISPFSDGLICVLDPLGNLIWYHHFGRPTGIAVNTETVLDCAVDADNCIYILGLFQIPTDFQPGPGSVVLVPDGVNTAVVKYDPSGNVIWAKTLKGYSNGASSLKLDTLKNLWITGQISNFGDLDPGPGVFMVNPSPPGSNWSYITKWDSLGNFIWGGELAGGLTSAYQIETDLAGNAYLFGVFRDSIDFVPGSGVQKKYAPQFINENYVAKYSSTGVYQWSHIVPGSFMRQISVSPQGKTSFTGVFGGTIDSDLGPASAPLTANGNNDSYLFQVNTAGAQTGFRHFQAQPGGSVWMDDIRQGKEGKLWVGGLLAGTADLDPGPGSVLATDLGYQDLFLVSMDSTGNYLMHDQMGGALSSLNYCEIAVDAWDNVIYGGQGWGSANMNYFGTPIIFNLPNFSSAIKKLGLCLPTYGTISTAVCDTQYFWPVNGITYGASGTYTAAITNLLGCDSLLTLNLSLLSPAVSSQSITACDSFIWSSGGATLFASGTYFDTLTAANGCDSVRELQLTIHNSTASSITQSACDSYFWPETGITYMSSGVYSAVLSNGLGCDSTVTLQLTVTTVDTSVIDLSSSLQANITGASYQWLDCGNGFSPLVGETNALFTPVQNGSYAVAINYQGCLDTSNCHTLIVNGLWPDRSNSGLKVSPNPTQGRIEIAFTESWEGGICEISDVWGRVLHRFEAGQNRTVQLDLVLPTGLYFLSARSRNGDLSSTRVVFE